MEIDEQWETGRRYMKMPEDDKNLNQNNTLLREIKEIKERVKTREGLMVR